MAASVKCDYREVGADGLLVIDRVQVADGYAKEEDEEVFVFFHDRGAVKAHLAMRGALTRFTPLERRPRHHREASLEIRVSDRFPDDALRVDSFGENSETGAERSLYRKIRRFRRNRIIRLENDETDFLRRYHDVRPNYEIEAAEGYRGDQTRSFIYRNAAIIAERKARDDYRCQACHFLMELQGRYIIDCHHKFPLARPSTVRVTSLDDLVCLCPTCHRIAHTRKPPLTLEEIRAARLLCTNAIPTVPPQP